MAKPHASAYPEQATRVPRRIKLTIAYCWASGLIEFGDATPKGAIPIMRGPEKYVRDTIEVHARHAYEKGKLLVPGIPEVEDDVEKAEALDAFGVRLRAVVGTRVNVRVVV